MQKKRGSRAPGKALPDNGGCVLFVSGCRGSARACAGIDLHVGNFFENGNILRDDGNTDVFVSNFVPDDSFPLGAAFGPDGNFYASNSNTGSIGKYNGATGAFISVAGAEHC